MGGPDTPSLFEFEPVERRAVVAGFDSGNITSNAEALLLGPVDRGLGSVRASLLAGSSSDAIRATVNRYDRPR